MGYDDSFAPDNDSAPWNDSPAGTYTGLPDLPPGYRTGNTIFLNPAPDEGLRPALYGGGSVIDAGDDGADPGDTMVESLDLEAPREFPSPASSPDAFSSLYSYPSGAAEQGADASAPAASPDVSGNFGADSYHARPANIPAPTPSTASAPLPANSPAGFADNSPEQPAAQTPPGYIPGLEELQAAPGHIPGIPDANVPPGHIPGLPDIDPDNPNGEPVETIDGVEGWFTRTALTGVHGVDKAAEGVSRFFGWKSFADFLEKRTHEQEAALDGKPVRGDDGTLQRLAPLHGAAQLSSNVVGGVITAAPSIALGGAGIVAMGLQSLSAASAKAHDEAKAQGATDEEATHAAGVEALKTLPETLLTAFAGKATGTILKKVVPLNATPLARAAAALVVGTLTNVAASSLGRKLVGKDGTQSAQDWVNALLFSTSGVKSEYTLGKNLATARSVVEGYHPEVAIMDSVAQGKLGDFTPQQRQLAGLYSIAIRQAAAKYIELNGYKAPTAKIVERPVFPVEKPVNGHVVGEGNPQITSSSPIVPTHEFPLSSPTLPDYLDPNRTYAGRNSPTHSATSLHRGTNQGDVRRVEDRRIQPGYLGLDGGERGVSVAGAASGRGGDAEENAGPFDADSAKQHALSFIRERQAQTEWLKSVSVKPGSTKGGAPMGVGNHGTLLIYDSSVIAEELNKLHARGLDPMRWLQALVSEEFIHIPQLTLARGEFKATYVALHDALPVPLSGIIGLIYYGNRDAHGELPPQFKMIEYERMIIQYRETGTITEELLGRDISVIRPYLEGPQPPQIQDHLDLVEAIRKGGSAQPGATPVTVNTRQQLLEQFARNRPLRPEEQAELIRLQEQSRKAPPSPPEIEGASSRHRFPPSAPSRSTLWPEWGQLEPSHRGKTILTRDGRFGELRAVGEKNVAFRNGSGAFELAPLSDSRLASSS